MPPGRKPHSAPVAPPPGHAAHRLVSVLLGLFLGLCLLKFGNPPIMEKYVTPPGNIYELLLGFPWPITWAYLGLAVVLVLGWRAARWELPPPRWLALLPFFWLGWQVLAQMDSVQPVLSVATVRHFIACVGCYALGLFCLAPHGPLRAGFLAGLTAGIVLAVITGWEQHFGGLEASRKYFFQYLYPELKDVPPEYLKKISSDRIFATLFYPNTLAGALLLVYPPALWFIWSLGGQGRMTLPARATLLALVAVGGLACLYWSGSKGGWLIALVLGLFALQRSRLSRQLRTSLVLGVLALGLAGFFWKYAGFFEKGATSVGARFDYWRAAVKTACDHPFLGTGPGTFALAYEKIKRPESEMARLVHNDYLEQASDSGWLGFLLYSAFIAGSLLVAWRRMAGPDPLVMDSVAGQRFAVWLGVFAWALQSLIEFGLYIPALAWPALLLLGWLLGQSPTPGGLAETNRQPALG